MKTCCDLFPIEIVFRGGKVVLKSKRRKPVVFEIPLILILELEKIDYL